MGRVVVGESIKLLQRRQTLRPAQALHQVLGFKHDSKQEASGDERFSNLRRIVITWGTL